ncbi:hypothetical protein EDD17DRAFT_969192 [Pisolithus thermaeus]|nr:hypothetical protein EDD17DRAFT_969192 [Pisolithus thermaeus]
MNSMRRWLAALAPSPRGRESDWVAMCPLPRPPRRRTLVRLPSHHEDGISYSNRTDHGLLISPTCASTWLLAFLTGKARHMRKRLLCNWCSRSTSVPCHIAVELRHHTRTPSQMKVHMVRVWMSPDDLLAGARQQKAVFGHAQSSDPAILLYTLQLSETLQILGPHHF